MRNFARCILLAGITLALACASPPRHTHAIIPDRPALITAISNSDLSAFILPTAAATVPDQVTVPAVASVPYGKLSTQIAGRMTNTAKDYGNQGAERRHKFYSS